MLIEARSLPADEVLDFDLCIVGSGPAGLAIAQRLEGSGLRIAVLESGGRRAGVREQRLNVGENVGRPYWPLYSARVRALGGTGNRWGGWCRPLDAVDLEERDWVACSGWPISHAEMARYHADAEAFLGLPPDPFGQAGTREAPPSAAIPAAAGFETVRYRFSPLRLSMGEASRDTMASARDTTLLLHATVTNLRLDPGSSRVGCAVVEGRRGGTFEVRAREFVLATGGIENARLLLAARSDRPAGLGNEQDLVGRYFTEHLHAPVAYLLTADPALRGPFFESMMWSLPGVDCGALAATAEAQRRHRLLALSLTVTPAPNRAGQPYLEVPPHIGIPLRYGIRRTTRPRKPQPHSAPDPAGVPWLLGKVHALREPVRQARFAPTRRQLLARATAAGLDEADVRVLYARSEQVPNRSSRVTLGDARDYLGMPVARLDWQVTEQDLASIDGWVERLQVATAASNVSRVVPLPEWREEVEGGPHHMGTTRMSLTPSTGVVDPHCRVHSLDNLHVAGSSVFPTVGYANPTLPLVALALRLADHLVERLRR